MLTGRVPIAGETDLETLQKIQVEEPVPPKQLQREVPTDLDAICLMCLEKDPARRYPSALELGDDLHRFLANEPTKARPIKSGERIVRWCRRNKLASAFLALLVTSAIGGTSLGVIATRNASLARRESDRARQEMLISAAAHHQTDAMLYGLTIAAAQHAWQNNDVANALKVLESCHAEFRGWEFDYLATHLEKAQITLRGHTGAVFDVSFSGESLQVLTASEDGTVKIWDATTGKELKSLVDSGQSVKCAKCSTDGKKIAAGSDSGVCVFDAQTGAALTHLPRVGSISKLVFSPNGKTVLCSYWKPGVFKLCDVDSGREVFSAEGCDGGVSCAAFSPDGSQFATGNQGADISQSKSSIELWQWPSKKRLGVLNGTHGTISDVKYSPDGKKLVSASWSSVDVWDLEKGQVELSLRGHAGGVKCAQFTPNGKQIISSGHDGAIMIWDAVTGKQERVLQAEGINGIWTFAVSPDGTRLVSTNEDQFAKIWYLGAFNDQVACHFDTQYVRSPRFSPDGKQIAVAAGKRVIICDVTTGETVRILAGHSANISTIAYTPDGTKIVSAGSEGRSKVWDIATGKELVSMSIDSKGISSSAISPNGRLVASSTQNDEIRLWDLNTGKVAKSLKGHADVLRVNFNSTGSRLASAGTDGTVRIWDVESGKQLLSLDGHTGEVSAAIFSPDDARIITGGGDTTIRVWSATNGQNLMTFTGHTFPINDVCISPDGKRIASGSSDKTIRVWDADTGFTTLALSEHANRVLGISFSPDGKCLATTSFDRTLRLWDANDPRSRSHSPSTAFLNE